VPKPYPPEFRRRALELLMSGRSVRDVAASLGIAESCLYRWKSQDLIDHGLKSLSPEAVESTALVAAQAGPSVSAAIQGAKLDKRVAIVERTTVLGGICVNLGTIPSKTLREAVLELSGYRSREFYGASYTVKQNITMADLMFRTNHVISQEIEVIRSQLMRNRVDVFSAEAAFVDHPRQPGEGAARGSVGDGPAVGGIAEPARQRHQAEPVDRCRPGVYRSRDGRTCRGPLLRAAVAQLAPRPSSVRQPQTLSRYRRIDARRPGQGRPAPGKPESRSSPAVIGAGATGQAATSAHLSYWRA